MKIEASVANKLILGLGEDERWQFKDQLINGVVFAHADLLEKTSFWKLTYEGMWSDWLAEQIKVCDHCQQTLITWLPLIKVTKQSYQTYRWVDA